MAKKVDKPQTSNLKCIPTSIIHLCTMNKLAFGEIT